MSLWLALIWLVCAAICIAVFGICRKHMADIGQQVAEETENRVNKILKAEREAESRLLEAFTSFDNPAETIGIYQKNMTEVFPCLQANPPWNWTRQDLELWRKEAESKQRANRSRSTVLAVVVIILAVNIAATATTVIALNSVKPVLSTAAGPAGISGTPTGQLPQPISVPLQSPPVTNLLPLPTTGPPIPADDTFDRTRQPIPDLDNSIPNSGDTLDKSKPFTNPNPASDTSDNDVTSDVPKDINQDVEAIPNCNTTESPDSQSKGESDE